MQNNTMSTKIVKNGVRWTVREGYESVADKMNLNDFLSDLNGKRYNLVKKNRVRSVITMPVSDVSVNGIYIKYFKRDGFRDYVKYLFVPTRAMTEWKVGNALLSRNINTALPLAISEGKKRLYLITEAVTNSEDVMDYCQTTYEGCLTAEEESEKKRLLNKLAGFIREIHDKGVCHYDLHAGNILIKFRNSQSHSIHDSDLYLMDLHSVRILKNMSFRKRLHNLAQIFNSLSSILTKTDKLDFLRSYGVNVLSSTADESELIRQIESQSSKIRDIHYRSRLKRCLKESSSFSKKKIAGMKIFFRKGYDTNRIAGLIDKHHNALISGDKTVVMKCDSKTALTRFPLESVKIQNVVVKQYKASSGMCLIKNIFRNSAGKKAWIAGNGLLVYGFDTPMPLALMEKKVLGITTDSYLIMEDVKDCLEIDRYIFKNFHNQLKFTSCIGKDIDQGGQKSHPVASSYGKGILKYYNSETSTSLPFHSEESLRGEGKESNRTPLLTDQLHKPQRGTIKRKRVFINDLAKTIGRMHNQNIFHYDLKTCNIMVKEKDKSFDFIFLDFDKVSFEEEITIRKRVKNLTQMNLSTPGLITITDRLRFLKEYLTACDAQAGRQSDNAQAGLKQCNIINEKKNILREIIKLGKAEKILYVSPNGDVTEDW